MRRLRWVVLCAVAALGLGLLAARAADKPEAEAGFTSIFNGKDLTGWRYGMWGVSLNRAGKGYQVENGVVYCTADDGGDLYTEKEYADFTLRFEFKLTENANNGIGIRAPAQFDAAYAGMEIQVLDDNGPNHKDLLEPAQYHGSVYGVFAAKRGHLKPTGQWNEEEITADGRRVTIKLNGATILDANLDDVKDGNLAWEHPGLKNPRGHIGFLGHGTRVEFRNLRIKELQAK